MNNSSFQDPLRVFVVTFLLVAGVALMAGFLYLLQFLVSLPMRRAERARLFLDVIETAVAQERPIEQTIISISKSREAAVGVRFHLLAAWLEMGLGFDEALARVPRLLPPEVAAMLKAGARIGDIRKVLPACRQLLKDAVSQTRGGLNYLVIITLAISPATVWVFGVIDTYVLPRFAEIAEGMMREPSSSVNFLMSHRAAIMSIETAMFLLMWCLAFLYIAGPRVVGWFPVLERLDHRLPWRRKRMQRDFSMMLSILLDAGVPEPDAVKLAGECAANRVVERRARRVVEALKQGVRLPEAVAAMDDSGEFRWRLTNAAQARTGFLPALAGWHESLDARAFQEEQAAAHGVTTALVLINGIIVGTVVAAVFMFLTSMINAGVLW